MFRSNSTTNLPLIPHSCFQHRLRSHLQLDRQASQFLSPLQSQAGYCLTLILGNLEMGEELAVCSHQPISMVRPEAIWSFCSRPIQLEQLQQVLTECALQP